MLQINDGSGWHNLQAYEYPKDLDGDRYGPVIYDMTMPGFRAAVGASNRRGHALFRLKDDEPGKEFWVKVDETPTLLPDRMMTVGLTLWVADLS
jgi:hypothetical protein